jgi:hypothetical protein
MDGAANWNGRVASSAEVSRGEPIVTQDGWTRNKNKSVRPSARPVTIQKNLIKTSEIFHEILKTRQGRTG